MVKDGESHFTRESNTGVVEVRRGVMREIEDRESPKK